MKVRLRAKYIFWTLFALLFTTTLGVGIYVYTVTSGQLASLAQLENPRGDLASTVLSEDGEVLEILFDRQRRTQLSRDSIPNDFITALIATEDRNFYDHWGLDSWGLLRAVRNNIFFATGEGASTVTQQLARNLYLSHERKLERKVRELFTAIEIERRYTKSEILGLYTNTVYYGRGAYGLKMAAHLFFNKSPLELTTSQCAYLVGVLKNPGRYSSRSNPEPGLQRRNIVLGCMRAVGKLTEEDYRAALEEEIVFAEPEETIQRRSIAPHFVEMVRQELRGHPLLKEKELNFYRDGLVIHTTLNAGMQRYANSAVQEHLAKLQKQFDKQWSWKRNASVLKALVNKFARQTPEYRNSSGEARDAILDSLRNSEKFAEYVKVEATRIQIGFPAIDPSSGAIRALVGSSKFGKSERYTLNRATQIRRQPGSAFKPFLYATVLEHDYLAPDSLVQAGEFSYDLPGTDDVWELSPHPRYTTGTVSLATALKFSINTVAGRLITEYATPEEVRAIARRMGIESPLQAVPAMALGSELVSPLELVSAYAVFPNRGVHVEPYTIERIEDRFGNVIYDRKGAVEASDAISERTAARMTSMLRGVINGGTAVRVRSLFPIEAAAGKTGTTNDYTDAWFVGYTPQLCAGVWVGFDDILVKFPNEDGQGGRAAAPIWAKFMQQTYNDPLLNYQDALAFQFDVVEEPKMVRPVSESAFIGREEPLEAPPEEPAPPKPVRDEENSLREWLDIDTRGAGQDDKKSSDQDHNKSLREQARELDSNDSPRK